MNLTYNLILQVAVGARVMLRRNMFTADSLVNGAMGTIVTVVVMVKALSGQKGTKHQGNSCAVARFCSMTRGWAE